MIRFAGGLLLLSAGCSTVFSFTPSTGARLTAREPACDFEVIPTRPPEGWEEIGVVDYQSGAGVDNLPQFKSAVREFVCKAGGDLVVTEVDGSGDYIRGAVMRKKSS